MEQLEGQQKPTSLLDMYNGPESIDNVLFERKLDKWTRKLNSCYANIQGSNLTCQDSRLPDKLSKIVFDWRLYWKKEKAQADLYAQNNTWKPIFYVPRERDDDPGCYSSDDQSIRGEPSVREVNPNNCEK